MRDSLQSWLFSTFGVLAIGATLVLGTRPTEPAKKTTEPPAASGSAGARPGDEETRGRAGGERSRLPGRALKEIEAFLRVPRGAGGKTEDTKRLEAIRERARALCYRIEPVILFVPDPLDSHLGAGFDQTLNGLQKAAAVAIEDQTLALDRHWFPWTEKLEKEHRSGQTLEARLRWMSRCEGEATLSSAPGGGKEDSDPGDEPGVVLFRRAPRGAAEGELVVVLLVGETPISGVKAGQLERALDLAHELARGEDPPRRACRLTHPPAADDPRPHVDIPLLGPSSSGTADSIRNVLAGWRLAPPASGQQPVVHLSFVSGSATAEGVAATLALEARKDVLEVSFSRTVLPDKLSLELIARYVTGKLGWSPERIAIVRESDSGWGQGLLKEAPDGNSPGPVWSLDLPLPSRVSGVRSEWDREKGLEGNATSDSGRARLRPLLALNLQDSGKPKDVIPETSATTTPLNDLSIDDLLRQLEQRQIEHVGLFLGDVRDKLFLAKRIRLVAPDTKLFTLESSLLLTHPKVRSFAQDMLVFSCYPLRSFTQLQGPTPGQSYEFATDAEQGLFNAFVAVRGMLAGAKELPLLDYLPRSPRGASAPALWVSAVGPERLVPLDVLAELPAEWKRLRSGGVLVATLGPPPAQRQPGEPSRWSRLPGFLVAAGAFGLLVLAVAATTGCGPRLWRWPWPVDMLAACRKPSTGPARSWRLDIGLLLVSLTAVFFLLLRPLLTPGHPERVAPSRRERPQPDGAVVPWPIVDDARTFIRKHGVASGTAELSPYPALTALAAASGLFALLQLHRRSCRREAFDSCPLGPEPGKPVPEPTALTTGQIGLRAATERELPTWIAVGAAGAAVLFAALAPLSRDLGLRSAQIPDPGVRGLFLALSAALLLAAGASIVRFLVVWGALRRFLEAAARSPLRPALRVMAGGAPSRVDGGAASGADRKPSEDGEAKKAREWSPTAALALFPPARPTLSEGGTLAKALPPGQASDPRTFLEALEQRALCLAGTRCERCEESAARRPSCESAARRAANELSARLLPHLPPSRDDGSPEAARDAADSAIPRFVALRLIDVVLSAFRLLRQDLFAAVAIGFLVAVAAILAPERMPRIALPYFIVPAFVLVFGVLGAIAAMNRDEVLSWMSGSTPGSSDLLSWGFLSKAVSVLAIPLLSLLAYLSPELWTPLLLLLQPFLRGGGG